MSDMSSPFEFEQLDAFIPGALGEPGNRVFYLQARHGEQVVSFRLEKEQVGMLGRYLGQLASNMGSPDPERDIAGLIEPVLPEWVVGTISVGVDEESGIIQVTAEELVPEEIEFEVDDDFTEADIEELLEAEDASMGEQAKFTLRIAQAAAFAEAAEELLSAGRPPCRLCGRPIGIEGHNCPRWN
ncbi:MAG: DUF3090 family protein [Actinobacteria bacterium]|jgi:uncharacterized repeat protein (TIGR03847 family)|uniref:Unannotated protein n=2 Tax=freshwater metagenome TaxID=449393 RepID=A0A6J7UEH0_9ZZZZ|nr:DUF3090 family protein [Actinomycetota bacterium]MSV85874.1 DUF3090 family protein [Actinomycetota bacterium]MSX74542.1 DUF3090 family protein [Actinomycetota bacterium]MSY21418.1 DUF3090 family protein [Actinomycetota bacterium]MTA73526.1 DUF3090 family protein [Actinomycetota bacterium]